MELSALPISIGAREAIATSIANYQRHARLRISIDTLLHNVAWCTAHQYEPAVNGRNFTPADIQERADAVLEPLRAEGITPIICVYTVSDGAPEKSVTKHRMATHITVDGQQASVLRIKHPRVLVRIGPDGPQLLHTEHPLPEGKWPQLAFKANQYYRRDHWRTNVEPYGVTGSQVEEVMERVDDMMLVLKPYYEANGLDVAKLFEMKDDGTIIVQNENVNDVLWQTHYHKGVPIVRISIRGGRVIHHEAPTAHLS